MVARSNAADLLLSLCPDDGFDGRLLRLEARRWNDIPWRYSVCLPFLQQASRPCLITSVVLCGNCCVFSLN